MPYNVCISFRRLDSMSTTKLTLLLALVVMTSMPIESAHVTFDLQNVKDNLAIAGNFGNNYVDHDYGTIIKNYGEEKEWMCFWNDWKQRDNFANGQCTYNNGRFSKEFYTFWIPAGRWY